MIKQIKHISNALILNQITSLVRKGDLIMKRIMKDKEPKNYEITLVDILLGSTILGLTVTTVISIIRIIIGK